MMVSARTPSTATRFGIERDREHCKPDDSERRRPFHVHVVLLLDGSRRLCLIVGDYVYL
jgi:hypothetical protein